MAADREGNDKCSIGSHYNNPVRPFVLVCRLRILPAPHRIDEFNQNPCTKKKREERSDKRGRKPMIRKNHLVIYKDKSEH
jgi:hypothetical protein